MKVGKGFFLGGGDSGSFQLWFLRFTQVRMLTFYIVSDSCVLHSFIFSYFTLNGRSNRLPMRGDSWVLPFFVCFFPFPWFN